MPLPLTRAQLDKRGCDMQHEHTSACADDILFIHSNCHTAAGTTVSYDKRRGVLTFKCKRCKKFICEILVAESDGIPAIFMHDRPTG